MINRRALRKKINAEILSKQIEVIKNIKASNQMKVNTERKIMSVKNSVLQNFKHKNDDSINHFVSGFAAGTLTSSLLGFSAYEKQSSNSTTTIVLKSDSSGVFKQYKPRSFKHAKYGLMLGTITMLWHMFVNSKPPPPKSQNISNT